MVKLFLDSFWPMVLAGIKYSIPMMLISFALGLVVALFVALGRNSKIKIISGICAFYVWIIRGTPLLVQLFIIFYGLPSVGIVFTPFVSAILGLTISRVHTIQRLSEVPLQVFRKDSMRHRNLLA